MHHFPQDACQPTPDLSRRTRRSFLQFPKPRRDENTLSWRFAGPALDSSTFPPSDNLDLQFIPEDDIHFPTLTVEETIRFAAKTRTPQTRIAGTSRKNHIDHITNTLLTVFGLNHCRNTRIGDETIRGISGGEKKRVSIAEALACRGLINCWDKWVVAPSFFPSV
jgi:hypothetical protein